MSPTSYRAAPPRRCSLARACRGGQCEGIAIRQGGEFVLSGTLLESHGNLSGVYRMSQLYVVVLAIIVTTLLAVAIYRTSRVKTKADYLVAGRSLPALVLVLTLLTSWIGAGSLFAGAENAYKNGFAALWQPAGGWFGLLLIYFIAPRARKFAQITLPDLLEARYNQTARVLGTFAILFAYIGITSYQFKGGGDVLHLIFPDQVTPELGTFIVAAFVIVTTALAGRSSVAYMDVAIGTLVTVICVIAAPYLLAQAGGWSGLHAVLPPHYFEPLGNFRLGP